jgi:hypothetical protein
MGFRKPTRSRCLIYHWGRAPRVHSFWSRHTLSIYQMLWYVIRTSHPEYARHRLISKALSIFRSTWRSSCRRHDAGLFQNPEYTNEQKLFGNRQICPVHWSTRRCRSLRQTNVYRENSCHWSRSKRNTAFCITLSLDSSARASKTRVYSSLLMRSNSAPGSRCDTENV